MCYAGPIAALSARGSGDGIGQKLFPVGSLNAQSYGGIYRIIELRLEGTLGGHLVQQSAPNRSAQIRLLRCMLS